MTPATNRILQVYESLSLACRSYSPHQRIQGGEVSHVHISRVAAATRCSPLLLDKIKLPILALLRLWHDALSTHLPGQLSCFMLLLQGPFSCIVRAALASPPTPQGFWPVFAYAAVRSKATLGVHLFVPV